MINNGFVPDNEKSFILNSFTKMILAIFYCFISLWYVSIVSAQTFTGQITTPRNGYQVPPRFEVACTISNLPNDYHLWIAVRKGNPLWPKEPEAFIAGANWDTTISEGGKGRYKLVLIAVDSNGHRHITEWIRIGNETSHFPGLESIPGSRAIHSIQVRARYRAYA